MMNNSPVLSSLCVLVHIVVLISCSAAWQPYSAPLHRRTVSRMGGGRFAAPLIRQPPVHTSRWRGAWRSGRKWPRPFSVRMAGARSRMLGTDTQEWDRPHQPQHSPVASHKLAVIMRPPPLNSRPHHTPLVQSRNSRKLLEAVATNRYSTVDRSLALTSRRENERAAGKNDLHLTMKDKSTSGERWKKQDLLDEKQQSASRNKIPTKSIITEDTFVDSSSKPSSSNQEEFVQPLFARRSRGKVTSLLHRMINDSVMSPLMERLGQVIFSLAKAGWIKFDRVNDPEAMRAVRSFNLENSLISTR